MLCYYSSCFVVVYVCQEWSECGIWQQHLQHLQPHSPTQTFYSINMVFLYMSMFMEKVIPFILVAKLNKHISPTMWGLTWCVCSAPHKMRTKIVRLEYLNFILFLLDCRSVQARASSKEEIRLDKLMEDIIQWEET